MMIIDEWAKSEEGAAARQIEGAFWVKYMATSGGGFRTKKPGYTALRIQIFWHQHLLGELIELSVVRDVGFFRRNFSSAVSLRSGLPTMLTDFAAHWLSNENQRWLKGKSR